MLSPGYYPATATFQASQLQGENNPFELDSDEVNFLSEPDLDSGRDEPRGAAILDSGSQHAAYDAILDRGALRDISACLTPKDDQKRELHERDPLVLVSSLESQTLPGPHSHLSVIDDHVADAVMEGRLAAVEASAAELKASNETLLASNKAIKDQNDAMHNVMTTMMERLANSNAAPDAVATGPENKGAAVPTAQPTAAGSDAGVQPALNPLPAHAAGSASASPNLEPVPANPPPHTLPPVVPALGMLPLPHGLTQVWFRLGHGQETSTVRYVAARRRLCVHFGGQTQTETPRILSRRTMRGSLLMPALPLLDCWPGTTPNVQQHKPSVCSTLR